MTTTLTLVTSLDEDHHGDTTLADLDVGAGVWTSRGKVSLGVVDEVEIKPAFVRDGQQIFDVTFAKRLDAITPVAVCISEELGGDISADDARVVAEKWFDDNTQSVKDICGHIYNMACFVRDKNFYFSFHSHYPETSTLDDLVRSMSSFYSWPEVEAFYAEDIPAQSFIRFAYAIIEGAADI